MLAIHGIKNCDTMQKAFKWFDEQKIKYSFYDYKEAPPTSIMIEEWLKNIPISILVNTRSTTFRSLSEKDKISVMDPEKCEPIIQKNPSILKRPILDLNGKYLIGFNEVEWNQNVK